MKQIILLIGLTVCYCAAEAQLLKKLKDKVDKKVEKTVDNATDGKKKESSDDNNGSGNTANSESSGGGGGTTLKAYSKYDFVPGERIIVFEDFAQDAVGDFPDKWNTNASGEVVTVDGKQGHWFMLTKHGIFMPEFIDSFPDNFTLEFDLICDNLVGSWGLDVSLAELADRKELENWRSANNSFAFNVLPGGEGRGSCSYNRRKMGTGEAANSAEITQFSDKTKPVHVAVWRQKERVRVYLNQDKTWDIPKGLDPGAKLNSLVFSVQLDDGKSHFMMTNLRLGVGAPDTRNKILKENKWVTHGILFDVNSDKIKPESYGSLKEIADLMKEYTDLKVKIVGHTDADGKDADNLDLSKRRAAAVKTSLAKDFGIDESRMETDGKGESEPIDKNDTPAGKANNRRVEFIKI